MQCSAVVVDPLVITEFAQSVECGVTDSSDRLCSVKITLVKAVV